MTLSILALSSRAYMAIYRILIEGILRIEDGIHKYWMPWLAIAMFTAPYIYNLVPLAIGHCPISGEHNISGNILGIISSTFRWCPSLQDWALVESQDPPITT